MSDLVNEVNAIKQQCKDSTLFGTFLENHDNPRFPSLTGDLALAKNAIAFTILSDGVPIIYQGQEQHFSGGGDPDNREAVWFSGYNTGSPLYSFIGAINQIRNQAIYLSSGYVTYKAWVIYSDTNTIAMRKGYDGNQIISIFTNKGANGNSYLLTLGNTGYTARQNVIDIVSCTAVTVDNSGYLAVPMGQGLPKVKYKFHHHSGGMNGANISIGILPGSRSEGQWYLQPMNNLRIS